MYITLCVCMCVILRKDAFQDRSVLETLDPLLILPFSVPLFSPPHRGLLLCTPLWQEPEHPHGNWHEESNIPETIFMGVP